MEHVELDRVGCFEAVVDHIFLQVAMNLTSDITP